MWMRVRQSRRRQGSFVSFASSLTVKVGIPGEERSKQCFPAKDPKEKEKSCCRTCTVGATLKINTRRGGTSPGTGLHVNRSSKGISVWTGGKKKPGRIVRDASDTHEGVQWETRKLGAQMARAAGRRTTDTRKEPVDFSETGPCLRNDEQIREIQSVETESKDSLKQT